MPVQSDFIEDYMTYTATAISPEIYRKWCAITCLAGALERRVWVKAAGDYVTFPNLYVFLVGAPGVGKQAIEITKELWQDTVSPGTKASAFHLAPNNMTKASLVDCIAKAKQTKLMPQGPALVYHSMLIAAEEGGVLLPAFDQEYVSVVNAIYGNMSVYAESRRTGSVKELKIERPQLNLLFGVQPAFLATFPPEAWATGLSSRVIMVYSALVTKAKLFTSSPGLGAKREVVLEKLSLASNLYGQMEWTPQAAEKLYALYDEDFPPIPSHSRLESYTKRRLQHILKLIIVSAIARTGKYIIDVVDVNRAVAWLHEAEALMPDIFREMVGRSDQQVLEELHIFITHVWNRNKRKPVTGDLLWEFVAQRMPSEKVGKLLDVAERSNIIQRIGGTQDLWQPRPKFEHTGVE